MSEAGRVVDPALDPAVAWAIDDGRPFGLVRLDDVPPNLRVERLPPFPLIGIGDRRHPIAPALDAIVEGPATVAGLTDAIGRAPNATLVATGLLRGIAGLPPERALPLESMAYGCLQAGAAHRAWLAARRPVPATPPGRLLVRRDGGTLTVVIDRPAARNAIDCALRDAIRDTLDAAASDTSLDRILLRSTGAVFGIGGDLAEFGTTTDPAVAHAIRMRTLPAHAAARCSDRLDVHAHGACIGASLEIAAFARTFTAGPRAWFQLPELAMGLVPGAGGCVSVARRIGRQRALLMLLSGRRVSVATALDWGLIDAIVDEPPVDPGRGGFDIV